MTIIQTPDIVLENTLSIELEKALYTFLKELADEYGYHFIARKPLNSRLDIRRKIRMFDQSRVEHWIDAVVADESIQPLLIFKSEYNHFYNNAEKKGVDISSSYPAIRENYQSIRSSIAVLAGNWSSSSLAMMRSFDINIFLIPFKRICDLLATYDIDFDWDEKDRKTALDAWFKYSALTDTQKLAVGEEMVKVVKTELENLILSILDETIKREIQSVQIELHSNLGEVKTYEFSNVQLAVEFLNTTELKQVFITGDSITLFDPPPELDDDSN